MRSHVSAALALLASFGAAQDSRPQAFVRARIASLQPFTTSAKGEALLELALAAAGIVDKERVTSTKRDLSELGTRLAFPIDAALVFDPAQQRCFAGALVPVAAKELKPVLAKLLPPETVLHEIAGQTSRVLLGGLAPLAPDGESFNGALARMPPSTRRLLEHRRGGPIEVVVDTDVALQRLDHNVIHGFAKLLLGWRFSGFVARLDVANERLALECTADASRGLLARTLALPCRPHSLVRFVPDGERDFLCVRVAPEGSLDLVRPFLPLFWLLRELGERSAASQFADALPQLCDVHATGELAVVGRADRRALLVGVWDSKAVVTALERIVARSGERYALRRVSVEPSILELADGAESVVWLAPGDGFVAVVVPTEPAIEQLRACLATRGNGSPPKALRERFDPNQLASPPILFGVTSIPRVLALFGLDEASGVDDPRVVRLRQLLAKHFAGELGTFAYWLSAEGGVVTLRVEL